MRHGTAGVHWARCALDWTGNGRRCTETGCRKNLSCGQPSRLRHGSGSSGARARPHISISINSASRCSTFTFFSSFLFFILTLFQCSEIKKTEP